VHTQDANLGNPALFQLAAPAPDIAGVQISTNTFTGGFSLVDNTTGFSGAKFPAAFLTGGDYNKDKGPIPPNAATFIYRLRNSGM
jgi:hypothetical protein